MKIMIPSPLATDFLLSKMKQIIPGVEIFLFHSGSTLASIQSLKFKFIQKIPL
jgi:hypothetical protein